MKDKFWLYKMMQREPDQFTGSYILDGHKPVKVKSLIAWAVRFESKNRHVKSETVDFAPRFFRWFGYHDEYWFSTVFLGIDHNFFDGEPLLFETMIKSKGGDWLDYQTRCSTWEQAEEMHEKAKEWLK